MEKSFFSPHILSYSDSLFNDDTKTFNTKSFAEYSLTKQPLKKSYLIFVKKKYLIHKAFKLILWYCLFLIFNVTSIFSSFH